jgi:hypothetical protein
MSLEATILVLTAIALIVVLPSWPYSRGWGYGPCGVIGAVFLALLVMALIGHVPV